MSTEKVRITATSVPVNGVGVGRDYESMYDADVCCGEATRNICVNLHIDPDQTRGVITNVQFYHLPLGMSAADSLALEPAPTISVAATATAAVSASQSVHEQQPLQRWKPLPDMPLGAAAPGGHLRLLVKELA
jgi:hypothetical protein